MENGYIKHPHTINELAAEICKAVDDHKNRIITDEALENVIHYWSANEADKLFDEESKEIRSTIRIRIGKKRMVVVQKILGGYPGNYAGLII